MAINDSLKAKRDQANKLVNEIIKVKENIQDVLVDADELYSQIDKKDEKYKKLIQSLDRINKTTESAIANFRTDKDNIKRLLTQANSFYEKKFIPLSQKIEDSSTGFRAKINQSSSELRELEKIKINSGKQYDEIKKFVSEYKSKSQELRTINSTVRRLSESTEKNKNKADVFLEKIQKADYDIKNILTRNIKRDTETQGLAESILKREKKSNEILNNIEQLFVDSEEKRNAIEDVYQISHLTGLSGEFGNRRNDLKEEVKTWEKRILQWTKILLAGLLFVFIGQLALYNFDIKGTNFDFNFYVRFSILSPIVYYLVFCSTQYNKAKALHDKYSFKTTLAMTIKSHIDLLTKEENFNQPERMDKILDFILEGFAKIYNEPYSEEDFKMKIKLANMKIDLQKNLLKKMDYKPDEIINTEKIFKNQN